jgi:hypothetical protein
VELDRNSGVAIAQVDVFSCSIHSRFLLVRAIIVCGLVKCRAVCRFAYTIRLVRLCNPSIAAYSSRVVFSSIELVSQLVGCDIKPPLFTHKSSGMY